jgi:2-oxoisovalerate dehydrogenase E1 component
MCGGRVLAEIMYADFMARAADEIFNQMAKWQAMSAGSLRMPLVLRVSVGSKYGAQHSQDWSAFAAHVPGLKVCFPATPWEAKGLMASALNGSDPVIFFESQRLYDMPERFHAGGVPEESYEIEIGGTHKIRDGKDITFLTIGAVLYRAVEAADILKQKYGLEAEIINLHSLVPLNLEQPMESVKKTGRLLLVTDACSRSSFAGDLARSLTELCFGSLKAPPVVVGARNWITPPFEYDADFFPQPGWILDAVNEKLMPLPGYKPTTNNYTDEELMRRSKAGV